MENEDYKPIALALAAAILDLQTSIDPPAALEGTGLDTERLELEISRWWWMMDGIRKLILRQTDGVTQPYTIHTDLQGLADDLNIPTTPGDGNLIVSLDVDYETLMLAAETCIDTLFGEGGLIEAEL